MDCSEFKEMLENYEELTDIQQEVLEDHAAVCESCREELEFFKSMINTVGTLPKLKAPKSLIFDINKRIDEEKIEKPKNRLFVHIRKYGYRYSAAAACIAIMAVVGIENSDLINRMMYHDNGVISEVSDTGIPSISPEVKRNVKNTEPTVRATAVPTEQSPQPKAVETQKPNVSAKPKRTVKPINTESPAQTSKPAARVTAVPRTQSSTSSANVSRVTEPPVIVYDNRSASASQEASKPVSVPQNNSQQTAEQTNIPETKEPEYNRSDVDSSYTFEQKYHLPDENTKPDENNKSDGYENNDSANPSDWAAASATLTIAPKDEERVRELIDIYTSDQIGDKYKIDSDRMQYMLDVLTQEGIEYNDSARQSANNTDGDLMLTLVIS